VGVTISLLLTPPRRQTTNSKQQTTNANKPKAKQGKANTSKKQPAAAGKKNLTPY
jgi:hypothetical protein